MLDYARRSVRISVLEAAANVLLARRMADNALSAIEALEAQVDQCSRELEAGKVARSSLMELQAELGEERMAHIESLGNLRNCNIKAYGAIGWRERALPWLFGKRFIWRIWSWRGCCRSTPTPYEHLCQSVRFRPGDVACRAESLRRSTLLKPPMGPIGQKSLQGIS